MEHFTSWYTYLAFFIIILAIYGVFVMIIWLIDPPACYAFARKEFELLSWQFITNRWVNSAVGVAFGISFTFLTVFDIITHWRRKKKCSCKEFYFKEDPYLFRLEVIFYFLLAPLNIIMASVNSALLIRYYNSQVVVLTIFLDLFPNLLLALVIDLFPLGITIYRILRDCCCKKNKDINLDGILTILSNSDLHDSFKDFAKSEWSVENVLLFDDIINFEKSKSLDDANKIIANYLEKGAPLEVNVTRKEADEVIQKVKDGEINSDLFSTIKQTTILNLGDTYARFIFSDEYLTWEFKNKMKNNL